MKKKQTLTLKNLAHILSGNLTLARMEMNGGPHAGDTVYINAQTAPTSSGEIILKMTIKEVCGKTIITHECEPYFGYNRFDIQQIVR